MAAPGLQQGTVAKRRSPRTSEICEFAGAHVWRAAKSTHTRINITHALENIDKQNDAARTASEPTESLNLASSRSTPIHNATKIRRFNAFLTLCAADE